MRRPRAVTGSVIFFAVAPGVVVGLVPWLLTHWHSGDPAGPTWLTWPVRVVGALLIVAGLPVLIAAFSRFVTEGLGTPAPVAPTERLVVGGLFRYVRNPMYVSVLASIVGQALLLWRPVLLVYAAIAAVAMYAFVRVYEEPTLARRYGTAYAAYRRAVPGWWPRRTPWHPPTDADADAQADAADA